MALVQFGGGDRKGNFESYRIVTLDRQFIIIIFYFIYYFITYIITSIIC